MSPFWRIDGLSLLLASLAAPAASFLIYAVWTTATPGFGLPGHETPLSYHLLLLLLATLWGALPAAIFGAPALLLSQAVFRRSVPLWVGAIAGMASAGLYVGLALRLLQTGHEWVFLIAPWTIEATNSYHLPPIIVAIVVSGGIGGLAYLGTAEKRQA